MNILVDFNYWLFVIDFGLVKCEGVEVIIVVDGRILGIFVYMLFE